MKEQYRAHFLEYWQKSQGGACHWFCHNLAHSCLKLCLADGASPRPPPGGLQRPRTPSWPFSLPTVAHFAAGGSSFSRPAAARRSPPPPLKFFLPPQANQAGYGPASSVSQYQSITDWSACPPVKCKHLRSATNWTRPLRSQRCKSTNHSSIERKPVQPRYKQPTGNLVKYTEATQMLGIHALLLLLNAYVVENASGVLHLTDTTRRQLAGHTPSQTHAQWPKLQWWVAHLLFRELLSATVVSILVVVFHIFLLA